MAFARRAVQKGLPSESLHLCYSDGLPPTPDRFCIVQPKQVEELRACNTDNKRHTYVTSERTSEGDQEGGGLSEITEIVIRYQNHNLQAYVVY